MSVPFYINRGTQSRREMEVSGYLINGLVLRNTMNLLKCDFNSLSIFPDSPYKAFSAARDAGDSLNAASLWAA